MLAVMKQRLREQAIAQSESDLYVRVDDDQNVIYPARIVSTDARGNTLVKVTTEHLFRASRRNFYSREMATYFANGMQIYVRCQVDTDYPELNSYWAAIIIGQKSNMIHVRYSCPNSVAEWINRNDIYLMNVRRGFNGAI